MENLPLFELHWHPLSSPVFCVYYVSRGILQENRQELAVFVLSILLVMLRSIINFTVLPAEQKPKLLVSLLLLTSFSFPPQLGFENPSLGRQGVCDNTDFIHINPKLSYILIVINAHYYILYIKYTTLYTISTGLYYIFKNYLSYILFFL